MNSNRMQPQSVEQLRIPPHSLEAEQAILATILADNEKFDLVSGVLNVEDFYSRTHQIIYSAIIDLVSKAQAADIITVPEYLGSKGLLDEIGGDVTVYAIGRSAGTSIGLGTYAEVIRSRALMRDLIGRCFDITEQCYRSDGSEAIDILGNAERLVSEVSERLTTDNQDYSIGAAINQTIDEIETRLKSDNSLAGIPTGLPDLDRKINGLEPGDMIVLAARPSMGKTTLAMNMVTTEATREGGKPIVFSIEMPRQQLIYKMLSSLGQVEINKLQQPKGEETNDGIVGGMDDEAWSRVANVMQQMKETDLAIVDDSYMTIPRMRLEIRKYSKKHGSPTLIMVDYLQLIRGTTKTDNRVNEISEISRGIKAIAKEFSCPVIVLSQLSRSLENRNDKRPINSDLRESGQIEQDADKILFIYRDEVYDENTVNKGKAEIIIGKARMGQTGKAFAAFRGQFSEFKPLASGDYIAEYTPPKKRYQTEGLSL